MRTYAVDNNGWSGWYSYENLKHMATLMDEEGDYQPDSPEANFITGYNTDTYADDSIEIAQEVWEYYVEECEEEERDTNWEEYLNKLEENFGWQLTHTWLRITNLHNESDKEIDAFGRECISDTMKDRLGM